jgi:hypothetical protein
MFEGSETTLGAACVSRAAVQAGRSGGGLVLSIFSKYFVFPIMMLRGPCQLHPNWYDIMPSLSRNVTTDDCAICYCKIKSYFFTNTLFATAKAKSTCGNICGQVFASDQGFVAFYPMKDQCSYFAALKMFVKECPRPIILRTVQEYFWRTQQGQMQYV